MPPRRKKRKTRRRASFSVINALEAYVYATILTEGVAGTSPWGFITGATDLKTSTAISAGRPFTGESTMTVSGAGEISLGDMLQSPDLALSQMSANFQSNLLPMSIAAFTTSISFRIGKKLLRRPISNINRNIMKPVLGAGIKL